MKYRGRKLRRVVMEYYRFQMRDGSRYIVRELGGGVTSIHGVLNGRCDGRWRWRRNRADGVYRDGKRVGMNVRLP